MSAQPTLSQPIPPSIIPPYTDWVPKYIFTLISLTKVLSALHDSVTCFVCDVPKLFIDHVFIWLSNSVVSSTRVRLCYELRGEFLKEVQESSFS
jgi:hypothetical protein